MRRLLIVNPAASGVTRSGAARVLAELAAGGPVEQAVTEGPGHATALAAAACADCSAIYVLSGDGGFNEAVNGMHGTVPIGFLPGGATNVLPRALGLPRDPAAAARRVARAERVRTISLGVVRATPPEGAPLPPRRFAFAAGVGLDAEVVRAVEGRGRRAGGRPGDLAFVWELARALARRGFRLEPALTVEGQGRAALAIAANCDPYTYAGPLRVRAAPRARFELGIDVVAPGRLGPAGLARLAWSVLVRPRHDRSPQVVYLHDADEARVVCDRPLPLEADGEDLGDAVEVVVGAERNALRVLV